MKRNVWFNLFLFSVFLVMCGLMSACASSQKYPYRPKNRKRCDCPHFSWTQPALEKEAGKATFYICQEIQ